MAITMQDHHLVLLMEECAEAAHRASKQLRFGRDEVQIGQTEPNHLRLRTELLDILIAIRFLEESNQIERIDITDIDRHLKHKQEKINHMLALSKKHGRIL